VLAPVPLQTVCLRHEPAGMSGGQLDAHTLAWCRSINQSGFAYLTPAQVDGRWLVRVSVGAELTEAGDIAALWSRMQQSVAPPA
jgi:aromatic-L-amino-acid decarboxylase